MIKKIIAFGCSNTYGTESQAIEDKNIDVTINPNFAYPKFLANLLNCDWKNYGVPGVCNQIIARNVLQEIQRIPESTYSDILILIGWTNDNRLSVLKKNFAGLFHEKVFKNKKIDSILNDKTYYQTLRRSAYKLGIFSGTNTRTFKDFASDIFLYYFQSLSHVKVNFYTKYATHKFLEERKLKYIAFPTNPYLNDSDYINLMSKNFIQRYDSEGNIIFSLLDTFHKLASNARHLSEQGHKDFAYYLNSELKNRNIL